MKLTEICCLRRIINSSYHPFSVIPKPDVWPKRERLRRFVAWQYGSPRYTVKKGTTVMSRILTYMSMHRKDAKYLKKYYSEERLNSALDNYHFEYKHMRDMLEQAHVLIDNNVLAQLAIYEPRTFESIVNLTKAMAIEDGRLVLKEEGVDTVQLDDSLFGEPYPRAVEFDKGPAKDHTKKPRKLRVDEF